MSAGSVRVLLVGESERGFAALSERLEKSGCKCQFAPSCLDAVRFFVQASFHLVLCSGQMNGFQTLTDATVGSPTSLFRFLAVESGGWWLPAVLRGERCSGAPALRPSEFSETLEEIVREAKSSSANTQAIAAVGGEE